MGADQHFFTCVCVCARASPAAPHAWGNIFYSFTSRKRLLGEVKFTRVDIGKSFKHDFIVQARSAARCASSFPLPSAEDQRVRLNPSARRAEVRKRRRSTSPLAATIQTHNLTNLPLLYDAARAGLIFVEGEHDQMLKVRACLERARLPAERACLLPCI